ncbi:MAG: TolB family protein, partial [Vicinamibacteria bacterium]
GVYLRKTDGSPAVRLGDGTACGISPDGRWVLSLSIDPLGKRLVLLPVKAGQPRSLSPDALNIHRASWIPDGKRVLIAANEPDRAVRLYLQSLEGEKPVPITPEGIAIGSFPASPDGQRVVAQAGDQTHCLFPFEGGEAQPILGLGPEDRPIRFSSDGLSLYAFRRGELPCRVFRLDLVSGEKGPLKELMPADPAGVVEIVSVFLTPDAGSYAYSYHRILSDLFLVEGLK